MPKLLIFLLTPALALAQVQLINPSLPVTPAAIATDRAGNIFVTGLANIAIYGSSRHNYRLMPCRIGAASASSMTGTICRSIRCAHSADQA